jgi:hypothetical protein
MMKMYSAESSIHVKASTQSAGWKIYLVPIKRCSQTVEENVKEKKKRERARKQTHTWLDLLCTWWRNQYIH